MHNASYDRINDSPSYVSEEDLSRLAADGVFSLRQNTFFDSTHQTLLNVQLVISNLLFRAANRDWQFIGRQFIEPVTEVSHGMINHCPVN